MKARRLPRDPGPAGWNALLPEAPPPRQLDRSQSADFLIIGAGFAGLAAARRLRHHAPDARIVVLDAVRIGEGPVGRNSGFMIDLPHVLTSDHYASSGDTDRQETWANRVAIDFALEAAKDYGLPDEAISMAGKVNGAATERGLSQNADYSRHLDALGEPHEMLDAQAMSALTGSEYYMGGLFTPGVAMLQPAMYARGMAEGLRRAGVEIYEQSPVTELTHEGSTWTAKTPYGAVEAPKVILAINGHAESFGFFRRRLLHVLLYASMTRALSAEEAARLGGKPKWGITPSDPMGSTVRRISGTGGDRIIVRNRASFAPGLEVPNDIVARMGQDHDKAFRARFPMLDGVGMEYRWAGRLCLSLNDVPAFGEVEPGLIAACCQNGLGTTKGTFNGMAAADLAVGVDSEISTYQAAKPPPKRLLPGPLMRIGAPLRIRWRERAAGREL